MDRKYIEAERIVDRYLSGELTVREAREFEKYCADNPQFTNTLPIPVRLKTRLARRAPEDSETGVFQAIPSSTTHAAIETADDGFDPDEEREAMRQASGGGLSKAAGLALLVGFIAASGAAVYFWMQARTVGDRLDGVQRKAEVTSMQAPGSIQRYRVEPSRGKPAQATLALGWLTPPQLLDLHIDVSEGKYTQFQITVDRDDGTRVMQLRRVARDSNREVRLSLNSSALGPGDFLLHIEGYTWRGQLEEIGWVRLGLQ